MKKLLKYALLRHLPGEIGRRYEQKYVVRANGFEEAVLRAESMTCIDLGANIGIYTRKMAARTKRVIAFEPDPWTFAELQANVADLENVRLENSAAGVREGMVLLYRRAQFEEDPAAHSEASSVISSKSDVAKASAVEVLQIDFLRYLEELDDDIGVLKMDIEGGEVDLLEALFGRPDLLRRIDHIFAETHERCIPEHMPRVNALRLRARNIERPYINLYWR